MRRFLVAALLTFISAAAMAQNDSTGTRIDSTRVNNTPSRPSKPKTLKAANLPRSNDHFMLQTGYTGWGGATDSSKTSGLSRSFNAYLMFDFPFKTNPHFSVGVGVGVGTDNVYFKRRSVDITGTTPNLVFENLDSSDHFKKYKLTTTYAEVPLELRFSSNPDDNKNSVKVALGVKVGTILGAHTKGKTLQNKAGLTLNNFKEKLADNQYFNKQRLAATARIGYGHFTLFGSYQITQLFKQGVAPAIHPYTIGLTLSGL